MPAQGRKNVHGKAGVRFKSPYNAEKRKSELRNLATELVVHGQVKVTSSMSQPLVTMADKLVGLAKDGSLAARRRAASVLRPGVKDDKGVDALAKLFSEIGPKYKDRQGGYAQVYKLGARKGDNAPIELVKWVD
jgi:large subunit ribosomal protein L17